MARPPAAYLGALAWDSIDDEAVYFGGLTAHGVSNQTWVFHSGVWTNRTASARAPSPRYGFAMAYDNQSGVDSVILFGGCDPTVACPLNDTWTFSGGTWDNVSASVGPMVGLANATMASWGSNGTILYGGCEVADCSATSNQTWAFQNSSACESTYHSPCWTRLAANASAPPDLAGVALTEWTQPGPLDGWVALYGGEHPRCSVCTGINSNATWLFDGASWQNVTSTYGSSPYPADGRAFAVFFWDPASDDLYLYGGFNGLNDRAENQLWTTNLYSWQNVSGQLTLPSPAPRGAAIGAPVPGSLPTGRTLLMGGLEPNGTLGTAEWVFEESIVNQAEILPNPAETNATVRFYSNATGGTEPYSNWSFGNSAPVGSGNASTTYSRPGNYTAQLSTVDLYGVQENTSYTVSVRAFSWVAHIPLNADVGWPAQLSCSVQNGTAPYNFTWNFGDGVVAFGPSIERSFSTAGSVTVKLTIRDATGTEVNETARIEVAPPLQATLTAQPLVLDVGTISVLRVNASGGSGAPTVNWTVPGVGYVRGLGLVSYAFHAREPGSINISVTLNDSLGATWAQGLTLTVNPALSFLVSTTSSTPTSGRAVGFSVTIDGGTAPYAFAWRFGDGGSSSASAPTHTYGAAGTYTVTAWVNDSGGGTYRQTVEVKIPRTSGGLLWEILALPLLDLIGIALVIAVVVVALVAVRHRGKSRERTSTTPPVSPGPTTPSDSSELPRPPAG